MWQLRVMFPGGTSTFTYPTRQAARNARADFPRRSRVVHPYGGTERRPL